MKIKDRLEKHAHFLLFGIISAFIAFSTNLTSVIVDNFHEGEYLGFVWHIRAYYNNASEFPLLIHGAVDYIPSVIASIIFGNEHIIVGTRLVGSILLWLEWVLFLDLGYLLIPDSNQKKYWAAGFVAIFIALVPALGSDYLTMQGAFVGTRDFFLVVTIWAIAKHLASLSKSVSYFFLWLASFGAAASIFWCYDRGVMAVAFIGVIILWLLIWRRIADAGILLLATLISLMLIGNLNFVGSTMSNIENIKYWAMHGAELWSYPFEKQVLPYIGGGIMVLFSIAAIWVALLQRQSRTGGDISYRINCCSVTSLKNYHEPTWRFAHAGGYLAADTVDDSLWAYIIPNPQFKLAEIFCFKNFNFSRCILFRFHFIFVCQYQYSNA